LLFGGFVACVRIIGVQFLILENQNRLLVCHEGNILLYDNHRIASWKIINILLGGLAIVVGIVVLIWLPDSPLHAQFLTYEERTAVLERVRDDQVGVKNKVLKSYQIKEALLDIRVWLIVLTTCLGE